MGMSEAAQNSQRPKSGRSKFKVLNCPKKRSGGEKKIHSRK
jgi:hypothetical protein